jgi:hypothetical protein
MERAGGGAVSCGLSAICLEHGFAISQERASSTTSLSRDDVIEEQGIEKRSEEMLFSCRSAGRLSLAVFFLGIAFQANHAVVAVERHKSPEEAAYRKKAIEVVIAKMTEAERVIDEAKKNGVLRAQAGEGSETVGGNSELHTAREKQRLIEDELLASQPADSEIGKALTAFVETKDQQDTQADRVLNDRRYLNRVKQVEDAVNAGALRIALRKDALASDHDYQAARDEFRYAKRHLDELKAELFARDAQWTAASQAVKEAGEKLRGAQAEDSALPNVPLEGDAETSSSEEDPVAAAQATIVQCRATLRQLGVKNIKKFLKDYRGEM